MIQVQVLKENGHYKKFMIDGHADYAEQGKDIVCAAVSVLVTNTINSIEEFTNDAFTCDLKDGAIQNWEFTSHISHETELFMDSLMLGLRSIQKSYGDNYLSCEETAL